MARTREEVISEMVDSGLFTDDEIREAAKKSPDPASSKGGAPSAEAAPMPGVVEPVPALQARLADPNRPANVAPKPPTPDGELTDSPSFLERARNVAGDVGQALAAPLGPAAEGMGRVVGEVIRGDPERLQGMARLATTGPRVGRAAGVGIQRLVEGDEPARALERAKEAVKPGYVAPRGERVGAVAGEVVGGLPAAAATGGGGLLAQIAKGSLTAGTMNALMEAAEKGDVEIRDVVYPAIIGAGFPIIAPSLGFVARAIRAGARVNATAGTTLPLEAAEEVMNDPALLQKYAGTAQAVGEKVVKVQKALVDQHAKVSKFLDRVRQRIGFREPFTDSVKRLAKEGYTPKSAQDIAREFQILKAGRLPVTLERAPKRIRYTEPISTQETAIASRGKNIVDDAGEAVQEGWENLASGELGDFAQDAVKMVKKTYNRPGSKAKREFFIPDKLRLRELYRLRESIDDHLNFPNGGGDVPKIGSADQSTLRMMRDQVNSVIETLPGGKILRAADQAFHLSRKLYDDLQKKIVTQGKAEQVIQQILKGGDMNEVVGLKGDNLRLLQTLERKTGQKFLEPLKKELAALSLRQMKATSGTGILSTTSGIAKEAAKPEGVARGLKAANKVAGFLEGAAKPRPKVSAPAKSALYQLPRLLEYAR